MTGDFLDTALGLARRRWILIAAMLLLAGGFAAGAVPLLDVPGYELGMLGALVATVLAAPVGISAARLERARPAPSPASAWVGASLVLLALLALLFAGSAVHAALGPCRALAAAGFFPLLAAPSALLGAAIAVVAALLARGRRGLAALAYVAAALLSLAATLRAAYVGPAAFAADPLLGYWPGPLYDEALHVDARLVLLRVEVVAWAVALVLAAEAGTRVRRAARPAVAASLALLCALGAAAGTRSARAALGLDGDRATVERVLGARRQGERCTLVLPAEKPAAAADELLRECEFHAGDVARALGISRPKRVTVFVYRSADEKRRLVGAAGTQYTKPWLAEIHLTDAPLPHPVLRHEIVHAVAAALAPGPLHVPARARVIVSAGLVEGLAVALEIPRGGFTIHEWCRAARELGLLPDVARIVGPAGFWGQPAARAYTAAGSFLAFLLDRYGAGPVARAYGTGDLPAALGKPLPALVAEWSRFLDGVEPPPGAIAAARARLSRPSLFARPCAREVARLEADATRAAASGRTEEACALFTRTAALTGAPEALEAAGDARARAGDLAGAEAAYREAARAAPEDDAALRVTLAAAAGDLAWRRGELAAARARYAAALSLHPDRAEERLLEAKRLATADAALSAAARPWLLGEGDPSVALAALSRSTHPLAAYLVGRTFLSRGAAAAAIPELSRAASAALPAPIGPEARFQLAEAECAGGAPERGEAVLSALGREPLAAADRTRAAAAIRRCAFERGWRR